MFHTDRVSHGVFGFDSDVITVDRGHDLMSWKSIGEVPEGEINGPTCGLHWPNLLHPDPDRNDEIVQGWVNFLKPYHSKLEKCLATNSGDFRHQLVHYRCTDIKVADAQIKLDFSDVDKLSSTTGQKDLILKTESSEELEFIAENIHIESESLDKIENKYLYTIRLTRVPEKKEAILQYKFKS